MKTQEYIKNTGLQHRKKFGQYFTPSTIARLMTYWVIQENTTEILDPAFGLGVFHEVLPEISKLKSNYTAYEIDSHIFSTYEHSAENLKIIEKNYLTESITQKYSAIIANPPYMKMNKTSLSVSELHKLEKLLGVHVTGNMSTAGIFLLKSLHELEEDGRLAYLMPYEFFNTEYGTIIKNKLIQEKLLKQIVIFSNEKDIFPEVSTTICGLFCYNNKTEENIKITFIKSIEEITQNQNISCYFQHSISPQKLKIQEKWTPILESLKIENENCNHFVKLSNYGKFSRGIATGANEFFNLNAEMIKKWKITEKSLQKCITRSNQIKKLIFTEQNWENLHAQNKPVYCLNITDTPTDEEEIYLFEGEMSGYDTRYLTSKRTPWYDLEKRKPAPLLCGCFNRGSIKIIRNYSECLTLTCFHNFYPHPEYIDYIDVLFIYLSSEKGQKQLKLNKRSYGNELQKFEPSDLNNVLVPPVEMLSKTPQAEIQRIMQIFLSDEKLALQECNLLFNG